jgi:hypothetical protein
VVMPARVVASPLPDHYPSGSRPLLSVIV